MISIEIKFGKKHTEKYWRELLSKEVEALVWHDAPTGAVPWNQGIRKSAEIVRGYKR
jgi:hypothetical protein